MLLTLVIGMFQNIRFHKVSQHLFS